MDDQFLHEARRAPRPEFTASLRRRLAADDAARRSRSFGARRALRRALGAALPVAAAIVALVAFPEVRAGAQALLEMFRVRNFVAVNVDPARIEAIEKGTADPNRLFGDVKVLREAAPTVTYDSAALAFAAAGFVGSEPTYLPGGIVADSVTMRDGHEFELTLDARRLADLLATLDIRDTGIPPAYDGARVQVRMARTVGVRYRNESAQAVLMQCPNPEISLPPGLERARLAEVGLRVLGLPAEEARGLADRIDWNSTILVPLPTGKTTFREVDVHGARGLLVEGKAQATGARAQLPRHRHAERVLLWSDGARTFALAGNLRDYDLVQMANSIP